MGFALKSVDNTPQSLDFTLFAMANVQPFITITLTFSSTPTRPAPSYRFLCLRPRRYTLPVNRRGMKHNLGRQYDHK